MKRRWLTLGIVVINHEDHSDTWDVGGLHCIYDPHQDGGLLTITGPTGGTTEIKALPSLETAVAASKGFYQGMVGAVAVISALSAPPSCEGCGT